jgi:hypothetical protein
MTYGTTPFGTMTSDADPPTSAGFADLPVTGSFFLLELDQLFGPFWNLH